MRLIDADELKKTFQWSEQVRLSIKEITDIINGATTLYKPTDYNIKDFYPKSLLRCEKDRDNVILFLDAMLGAASYQMEDEDLIALYDELIKRFKNYNTEFSEYGNLIYSSLIMAYGDYGTSPRTGWFESSDIAAKCADYVLGLKILKEEIS